MLVRGNLVISKSNPVITLTNSICHLLVAGETFFEGLLTNGWLLKLVQKCGKVEKSIATWTFHLSMLNSFIS